MFGKQNKHILWFSILLLFGLSLSSCDKGNEPLMSISKDSPQEVEKPMSPLLSNQEAVAQATKFYKLFAGEGFRSSQVPKVKEVIRTNKSEEFRSLTMGEVQKAGLLIVNFEKDKGFAIMSENRYGEPLLGISTSGNLNEEATQANPNLQFVLGRAMAYAYTKTPQTCKTCGGPAYDPANLPPPPPGQVYQVYCTLTECKKSNSVIKVDVTPPNTSYDEVFLPNVLVDYIEPMLDVLWGQSYPYNKKIPLKDGKRCPAGCVAVAVGQIMSYYKFPKTINWLQIINEGIRNPSVEEDIATLLYDLGKSLQMDYDPEGSGAYDSEVLNALWKYGYQCSEVHSYNTEEIKSELIDKRIVYVSGASFRDFKEENGKLDLQGYRKKHAWVIDGLKVLEDQFITYKNTKYQIKGETFTKSEIFHKSISDQRIYFNCNFGWSGWGNGYYLSKVFNPFNSISKISPPDKDGVIEEGADSFYQYDLSIITNISPR